MLNEREGFKKLDRQDKKEVKKELLWMGNIGTTLIGRDWIRCLVCLLKLRIKGIE